jgi:hypothetical protein
VPLRQDSEAEVSELAAAIAKGSGALLAEVFEAIEDGHLDAAEARHVKAAAHEQMERLEKIFAKADDVIKRE